MTQHPWCLSHDLFQIGQWAYDYCPYVLYTPKYVAVLIRWYVCTVLQVLERYQYYAGMFVRSYVCTVLQVPRQYYRLVCLYAGMFVQYCRYLRGIGLCVCTSTYLRGTSNVCTVLESLNCVPVYVCNIPAKFLPMNIASGTGSYLAQNQARQLHVLVVMFIVTYGNKSLKN